jgi:hypothetical protein
MAACNAASGVFAIHHSAVSPTKASSPFPTRTRTVVCAESICEPIAAKPKACWAVAQNSG